MAYINDYAYYANSGAIPQDKNWGSYQYVSLNDIVNNFMLMYQGNHELINNLNRYQVLFHAKRGIQELNYDAMKEVKVLQMDLDDNLRFILPSDYVNWVRISQYLNGVLYPLTENIQAGWASTYLQDNNAKIIYDQDGNVLKPQFSQLDMSFALGPGRAVGRWNLPVCSDAVLRQPGVPEAIVPKAQCPECRCPGSKCPESPIS